MFLQTGSGHAYSKVLLKDGSELQELSMESLSNLSFPIAHCTENWSFKGCEQIVSRQAKNFKANSSLLELRALLHYKQWRETTHGTRTWL